MLRAERTGTVRGPDFIIEVDPPTGAFRVLADMAAGSVVGMKLICGGRLPTMELLFEKIISGEYTTHADIVITVRVGTAQARTSRTGQFLFGFNNGILLDPFHGRAFVIRIT